MVVVRPTMWGSFQCVLYVAFLTLLQGPTSSADTSFRTYNEEKRVSLPGRFKEMGVHGHIDMFQKDIYSLYIPKNAKSPTCLNDSQLYLNSLNQYDRWAVQMLDSSGNIPSGLLHGSQQDLGNYEECLDVAKESPYTVQYCVLWMKDLTKLPVRPSHLNWEKINYTTGGVPLLKPYLQIGLCLPASCDREDILTHYTQLTAQYNMSVMLDKYSCSRSDEKDPPKTIDFWALGILLTSLLLGLLATIYDVFSYGSNKKPGAFIKLLNCYSFYRNGKSILKCSSSKKPLSVLHGIRVLSSVWIVIAHEAFLLFVYPIVNTYTGHKFSSGTITSGIWINGELAVDTFFLLNGILLTYNTYTELKKGRKFNLPVFYLHHFLRIAPAYYMQFLIMMSIYRYMNSGPLWKYYLYTLQDNCKENWWNHVLFLNNYIDPERQCVPSDWYMAVDMQLYLISPLILIPLAKDKKIVPYIILPILVIVGNAMSVMTNYINDYPATYMPDRFSFRSDMFASEYVPTHLRFSPWLIGIIVGYIIAKGDLKISKFQARLGWILSTSLLVSLFVMVRVIHMEAVEHNPLLASLHNGLHSTVWAVFLAWVIVASEFGYGGYLKILLSWKAFQPVSKLTFTIYLIGIGVQFGLLSIRMNAHTFIEIQTYRDIAGALLITVCLAPIYSLLFECPYMMMNKIIVNLGKPKSSLKQYAENIKRLEEANPTEVNSVKRDIELKVPTENGDRAV